MLLMPDLLVQLYRLKELPPALDRVRASQVAIRRALVPEQRIIVRWVAATFSEAWADECAIAFARQPVACFVALRQDDLCGFAVYEATCRNFFGPLGVNSDWRGKGIGEALLLASLHALRHEGYAYAIIGGSGPTAFFQRTVGAIPIEDSEPGIYGGMLRS